MIYGPYNIDVQQEKPGEWKAHISRTDGRKITTAPYGPDGIEILSTNTFFSKEDALAQAKAMIDAGGMQ